MRRCPPSECPPGSKVRARRALCPQHPRACLSSHRRKEGKVRLRLFSGLTALSGCPCLRSPPASAAERKRNLLQFMASAVHSRPLLPVLSSCPEPRTFSKAPGWETVLSSVPLPPSPGMSHRTQHSPPHRAVSAPFCLSSSCPPVPMTGPSALGVLSKHG